MPGVDAEGPKSFLIFLGLIWLISPSFRLFFAFHLFDVQNWGVTYERLKKDEARGSHLRRNPHKPINYSAKLI
jgi:hypothetical protein